MCQLILTISVGLGGSSSRSPFSSASNEKRDETRRLIQEAKDLVARGKEIISGAEREMYHARNEAEFAIGDYSRLCRDVSRKLGDEIAPAIQQFHDFNIDARVTAPKIGACAIPRVSIPESSFVNSPIPAPDILGMFLDEYQYDKAKEQYEAAKAYCDEARATRERMRSVRDQMRQIKQELKADGVELKELSDKVISITNQLKAAMSQLSFTREEAEQLKNISKIANIICQHLSATFLNNDATISRQFQRQAATMKKLNAGIPAFPRVDDQRLLLALRELSDIPLETRTRWISYWI